MLPISDSDTPGRRFPIVTWLLIAVNVLVFLYELSLGTGARLEQFIQNWGAVPSVVLSGSLHGWLTLITSQFIHAGWVHIGGNMLFLYIFGDDIEDVLGPILYLLFYLFCGVVAGLTQSFVLARLIGEMNTAGIGASGAIAGVLGAYLVLYPRRPVQVLSLTSGGGQQGSVPAYVMLGLWFITQFISGITALDGAPNGNVGFWAHIGGFIAGAILILPFRSRASSTYSAGPGSGVRLT
ncbi:MAG TPA: rhomboid family intramembrane serine protease [Aggregatilineales bacterium]|nr:rhomboid family intramembrane serine protease [Aggregatilineales bacterium]